MTERYLLNAKIAPMVYEPGVEYVIKMRAVSEKEAREIVERWGGSFISAIGHEATAKALEQILGRPVAVNRIAVALKHGDEALIFALKGRLPEGTVIRDVEELKRIGYELWHLVVLPTSLIL